MNMTIYFALDAIQLIDTGCIGNQYNLQFTKIIFSKYDLKYLDGCDPRAPVPSGK